MTISKDLTANFPIFYENEKYIIYFYNCPALKKEVDNLTSHNNKFEMHIKNATFYSEQINNITGIFIIGKSEYLTNKFPYPFILDCNNPILIEVVDGNIVKFKQLSDLVSTIRKACMVTHKNFNKEFYNDLCTIYGKNFLNEVLPYEDIIYYFN